MLINVIKFEIRDFNSGIAQEYQVENTAFNYERIAAHRFTRGIEIVDTFDFQFARERNYPAFMINFSTESENELCDIDEMTGAVA